jgi:hypothetical protein
MQLHFIIVIGNFIAALEEDKRGAQKLRYDTSGEVS